MTLGYAMGAEFSLATNVFNIKDYNGSFKPQDFGGHSVTNNFSLIFTYARESAYMNVPSPYNYGYKSNIVGYGSLGFSAGYSRVNGYTWVWKLDNRRIFTMPANKL